MRGVDEGVDERCGREVWMRGVVGGVNGSCG